MIEMKWMQLELRRGMDELSVSSCENHVNADFTYDYEMNGAYLDVHMADVTDNVLMVIEHG